jgi:hypothetical protein
VHGHPAQPAQQPVRRVVAADLVVPVGDHHHRGRAPDAPAHVPQHVEGGVVGPVDVLDHQDRRASGVGELGEHRGEHVVPGTLGQELFQPRGVAGERVAQRAERPRGDQVVAPADEDPRAPPDAGGERPHHAALADAGLTAEEHHAAPALRRRGQGRGEQLERTGALEQSLAHLAMVTAPVDRAPAVCLDRQA